MDIQQTNRVIVKNLPVTWTLDHLRNFLEVVTPLAVADDGIQVFQGIMHMALVTLEGPVSEESLREAQQCLGEMPFEKNILRLKPVSSHTCSLIVYYDDPDQSRDHLFYYFDNPVHSGCGDGEVEDCEMHSALLMAVVHFSLPEAVEGVVAKGNHVIKKGGKALEVEPWYEDFHRPLLNELLSRTRGRKNSPYALKPEPMDEGSSQDFPAYALPAEAAPSMSVRPKANCGRNDSPRQQQQSYYPPVAAKPASPRTSPEVETLMKQMERLQLENFKLKATEADKKIKDHSETVMRQRTENERLKSENEKLKKQVTVRVPVPSHQLQLLTDFVSSKSWEGCKLTLLELEEEALFHGTEEGCEEAKRDFLLHVQSLADDALRLSDTIGRILETTKGKRYLEDIIQKYPGCSARFQNSTLLCAAKKAGDLRAFQAELQENIMHHICKIPPKLAATPQFEALRGRLERDFLVVLTLPVPADNAEDNIQLDGFRGDVEMAAKEVDRFTSLNRSDSKRFHIPGDVEGNACKKWFYKELDEVKQLIRKNGEIEGESTDGGYTLTFQCRQEVLQDVMEQLDAIKDGMVSVRIDLNKEFPKYHERALVINGLHSYGVRPFCSYLGQILQDKDLDSFGDFTLPGKCHIPEFRLKGHKDRGGQAEASYSGHREWRPRHSKPPGRGSHHDSQCHTSKHHRPHPDLPYSIAVGNTNITVKSGDITAEQVDVAVSVVGKDMNPKGTAIGSAFLKKCPSLAQALQANRQSRAVSTGGQLVTTPVTGGTLPMSTLFHTVLSRMPQQTVSKTVKQLVAESLQLAVQNGFTSIAFSSLGVGRRFGHGRYTTASAMMAAFTEFLQASPDTLQNITIVVYDTRVAGKFAQLLNQKMGGGPTTLPPTATATAEEDTILDTPKYMSVTEAVAVTQDMSVTEVVGVEQDMSVTEVVGVAQAAKTEAEDNSSDTNGSDSDTVLEEPEVSTYSESTSEKFEALVCTLQTHDCKEVIEILLKVLRTTFLCHEMLTDRDADTFYRLDRCVLGEILASASKAGVHLSKSGRGLRLCGLKDNIHQVLASIRTKMYIHVLQQTQQGWDKRLKLGLPVETDHLPSYWKVCRKDKDRAVSYEKAFGAWEQRGIKLNTVTPEERTAVEKLVQATWEAGKAGAGKDARNLTHNSVQVMKVERLENPRMWQDYSYNRERMFSELEHHHKSPSAAHCTPVENLPNSRGPVKTTENISKNGPLCREIYPEVNEHYLFHGTKTHVLHKICRQGLDFRVANNRTMMGSGVYAAESSTKADQYTDPKSDRAAGEEELTMILMRMLLGEPFIHKEQNPKTKFTRPPCRACSKTHIDCMCVDSHIHNSIIDDVRIFREFIVYDQHVCYPEYFITYKRVTV